MTEITAAATASKARFKSLPTTSSGKASAGIIVVMLALMLVGLISAQLVERNPRVQLAKDLIEFAIVLIAILPGSAGTYAIIFQRERFWVPVTAVLVSIVWVSLRLARLI